MTPTATPQVTDSAAPITHAREDRGAVLAAWAGFLFGTAISVGGNVLATWLPRLTGQVTDPAWSPGLWPQVGAAVWPLALLLSVEVLTRTRWRVGIQWSLARLGGILAVALGGAVISYGHLHEVLTAWHYPPAAAFVGPLVIDGLMLISGFALLSISKNRTHDAAATTSGTSAGGTVTGNGTAPAAETADVTATTGTATSDRPRGTRPARQPATSRTGTRSASRTRTATGSGSGTVTGGGTVSQDKARAHWDSERAAGREPSGAELARVAGVDPSLGRRWRRDWLRDQAPAADQTPDRDPDRETTSVTVVTATQRDAQGTASGATGGTGTEDDRDRENDRSEDGRAA